MAPPLPPKPQHLQRPRGGSGLQPVQHLPPRPHGVLLAIARGMIENIEELGHSGANPVWVVTMKGGGSKLIVKKERQFMNDKGQNVDFLAKGNLKAMNSVMGQASPTAVVVKLEPSEVDALSAFGRIPEGLRVAIGQSKPDLLKKTPAAYNLVKMKYDSSFTSSSATRTTAMNENDKQKATELFTALRGNTLAWKTLGAIIIADALIGNQDRIGFRGGTVFNYGNLIFSRNHNGEITHALGLDTIDVESRGAALLYGTNVEAWARDIGQYIKAKWSLPGMAQKIIGHINQNRMVPLNLAPFGHAEIAALAEGMVVGWDKQGKRIADLVRQGKGIPSGMMARAKYLGWVK